VTGDTSGLDSVVVHNGHVDDCEDRLGVVELDGRHLCYQLPWVHPTRWTKL